MTHNMKIPHALHILRVRRAIGILLMVAVAMAGYFYVEICGPFLEEDHPKFAGFVIGVSIFCSSFLELYLFWRLCRITQGIHHLGHLKQRNSLTVSHFWMVKFKSGSYDL